MNSNIATLQYIYWIEKFKWFLFKKTDEPYIMVENNFVKLTAIPVAICMLMIPIWDSTILENTIIMDVLIEVNKYLVYYLIISIFFIPFISVIFGYINNKFESVKLKLDDRLCSIQDYFVELFELSKNNSNIHHELIKLEELMLNKIDVFKKDGIDAIYIPNIAEYIRNKIN